MEILGFEYFPTNGFLVGMLGQLVEAELALAGFGQRHDVELAADQHRVALPGHPQLADLLQDAVDGDVDTADALQEIVEVHRRDRRHHPAVAGRVQVDIRPDHPTRRVVPGAGQVIEVVAGDVHVRRILLRRVEPGIDVVVAVPAIEIEAGDQRIAGVQLLHQRIETAQSRHFFQILLFGRGGCGIETRRTAVVVRAVAHASGVELQRRQRFGAFVRQRTCGEVAKQDGGARHLMQLLADDPCLAAYCGLQFGQRRFAQVFGLRVADRVVGQEIGCDQHHFHQYERNQRALDEGAPDPLAYPDGRFQ